jgi:hypothetical protein
MPTENELKFVLKLDDSIQYEAMEAANETIRIRQGYLETGNVTLRVREQLHREGVIKRFLQMKTKAKGSGRQIEVSAPINERDFKDLWKKTKATITKIRYVIKTKTHDHYEDENGDLWTEHWDVDFMKTGDNETYFSVAEVELPEMAKEPLFEIPGVVQENTLFRVPLGDSRFSNSRLWDVGYATKLYKSLFSIEEEE